MIPFPDKKYNIIYADPPWSFRAGGLKNATNHYNCMSIEDIKSLPVSEIADDNCLLFLWVIYPLLPECIETLKSWGFAYSTCGFTWVKKNKVSDSWFWGLGCYTRSNPEICLIGKKGKFKKQSSSVHSVLDDRIRKHSQKPDCVRDKIVDLCGDLPRIELFARNKTEGWDCWGNEV